MIHANSREYPRDNPCVPRDASFIATKRGATPLLLAALIAAIGLNFLPMAAAAAPVVVDFSDLSLPSSSYWCGPDPDGTVQPNPDPVWGGIDQVGQFTSGGVAFENRYSLTYQSDPGIWEGFAYSNIDNTTTPGYTNQFAAVTGGGINGPGSTYAVAYEDWGSYSPTLVLPVPTTVLSADITNATYPYLSMLNGDSFGKKFTGSDWFELTINAFNENGQPTGTPVNFYLAQGTSFVTNWANVNLAGLGSNVKSLQFDLNSSDTGEFGMNTPAYFALGGLTYAGPLVWTGSTNSLWSQGGNWGGTALTGSQAIAFSGSNHTASVNDLPPCTQFSSVNFNASAAAFTLSGNSICLAGNLTNNSTCTQSIDLGIELVSGGGVVQPAAGNIVIAGNIGGSGGLTESGPATLILSGSNDYSGGTVVVEGTLEILDSTAFPSGTPLTVESGGTVIFGDPLAAAPAASQDATAALPEPGMPGLLAAGGVCFGAARFLRRRRVE
jgi:autotransporter-associated beta strand protein